MSAQTDQNTSSIVPSSHMAPLIYLDTSDFSSLADVGRTKNSPDDHANLKRLTDLADSGTCRFAFSYVHVCEILKQIGENRDLAVRKMDLIHRLCGDLALRYPPEVWSEEIHCLEIAKTLQQADVLTRGRWFPIPDHEPGSFVAGAMREMEDNIRTKTAGLPRRDRRKVEKQMGSVKRNMLALLSQNADAFLDSISAQIPIPPEARQKRLVERFCRGELGERELFASLIAIACQPHILARHQSPKFRILQDMFDDFGRIGEAMVADVNRRRTDVREAIPSEHLTRLEPDGVRQIQQFDFGYITRNCESSEIAAIIPEPSKNAALPSIHLHTLLFRRILADAMRFGPNAPKLDRSDMGDLLHAIYAPYVDLFRTDKRVAEKLRQLPRKVPIRASSSSKPLLPAIDELLADFRSAVPRNET